MDSFRTIGQRTGTDKITHHGYHRFYPQWLDPIRETTKGILEIGIDKHHSLALWKEYFPNAFVYGMDIGIEYTEPRVHVIQGDQSSSEDLNRVIQTIQHPIQCIVDDGSHVPEHQIGTFNILFLRLLEPGGIYIVEDIETSYWTKNSIFGYPTRYGYRHPNSFVEQSKHLIDCINSEFLNPSVLETIQTQFSKETIDCISSISFGQNCVIFKKQRNEEAYYKNRVYRFQHNL